MLVPRCTQSIKSLHNPRFAPTNTHALVKAWHYKIIDQL